MDLTNGIMPGGCFPPTFPIPGRTNKIDDAAKAEVEADALEAARRRQEEQLRAMKEMHDKERAAQADIRNKERERMGAEGDRFEAQATKLLELKETSRVKDQARESARTSELDNRLQEAVKESDQSLDNQRNFNSKEKTTMLHDNQQVISGIQGTTERVEERTAGAVLNWTKQKGEQEAALQNEKIGYSDKTLAETKVFHAKQEALLVEQGDVELALEKGKTVHAQQMTLMEEAHKARKLLVQGAYGDHVKEMTLRDAVISSRDAANVLSELLAKVISFRGALRNNRVTLATVNPFLEYRDRALNKLEHLLGCSNGIVESQETNHPKVLKCQEVARKIITEGRKLRKALTNLTNYVTKKVEEIDKDGALEEIKKIEAAEEKLYDAVDDLPSVQSSDHLANALIRCAINIASGNLELTDAEKEKCKMIEKTTKSKAVEGAEGAGGSGEPAVEEAE